MTKKQVVAYLSVAAKYFILFGVVFILCFAKVDAEISPFAVAFLFACVFLPVKIWTVPIALFLSKLFVTTAQIEILAVLFSISVFIAFWIFSSRFKKIKNLIGAIVAYIISNGFTLVHTFITHEGLYKALISIMAGCVFLACVIILINTVKIKRAKIPWTIDQKICAAIFVIIFALGLSGIDLEFFSVHKFISIYIILMGVYMFDARNTLVVAVCLGLGNSLAALNLNYVAIYTLLCAVAMAFKSRNTIYSIVALFFTDIVLGTYFDAYINYSFYSVIPIIAAICAFVLMPPNLAKHFDFSANSLSGHLVSKNTINKNRAGVYSRLNSLASVFSELQNIYRSLVSSTAPTDETKLLIAGQVQSVVCENCANKTNCMREINSGEEIKESFVSVANIGLNRGSVNFLDIPQSLTIRCTRINSLLSTTNSMLKRQASRDAAAATLDTGKILMSQLLSGLNKLMVRFAADACSGVVFDNELADLIREELLYKNIVASDCLITKTTLNEYTVSVLVTRADSANRAIEQVVSRCVRRKMQLDSIDDSDTAGFAIVTVKTAPRFQVIFGVAQVSKNWAEASGDIYSFLKINNEKTMMAVCDGMGAGQKAEAAGMLALSLVENFYKAGFPNEMIMTSVNQLLQISAQEIFSALDIAIFNLSSGEIDFIKVGASDGFIKRERTVEVVEAGSLPLGILEEMQPKITRAVLSDKDMIIIASDGVNDSFGDRVALGNFINNLPAGSPQELADMIMQESLNRSGRIAKDDCTVIVGKLTER